MRDGIEQGAIGFRGRDEFEQAHVAWRIEKMGAKPGAPEVIGETFSNLRDWKAAGVSCDDGSWLTPAFDFFKQRPL